MGGREGGSERERGGGQREGERKRERESARERERHTHTYHLVEQTIMENGAHTHAYV